MQIFRCDHCQSLIFFENSVCTRCGHTLAFLPDHLRMAALVKDADGAWHPASDTQNTASHYRLCANYQAANVCNWAIADSDPHPLCPACRYTRVIPDLEVAGNALAWYRLEVTKRRLLYSLLDLRLPLVDREQDPQHGLAFEFLADPPADAGATSPAPVLTGHASGVITISLAEADDVEREKRRTALHEPYRTLLGHFRHEIGHYYWDHLIAATPRLDAFRACFGDERRDYAQALQQHYQAGAAADWQQHYISTYASAHPWEDWAETWAHYLHLRDTLQTAQACGLSLPQPAQADHEPESDDVFTPLMDDWFSLSFVLNNLNRGLGLPDAYPFLLSSPVIDKLRFVHETIAASTAAGPASPMETST